MHSHPDPADPIGQALAALVRIREAPPLPQLVSQRNSEEVLSIDARGYLAVLPKYEQAGGSVIRLGKLRLVDRAAFVAWLSTRGSARSGEPAERDTEGDQLATKLGLRLIASRRTA